VQIALYLSTQLGFLRQEVAHLAGILFQIVQTAAAGTQDVAPHVAKALPIDEPLTHGRPAVQGE
jgi:hypothetical protein